MLMPFLINPRGRRKRRNPPHPGSYGAAYPLTFGEGIGGKRRPVGIPKITKAEAAHLAAIKSSGEYIPLAERGGTVVAAPRSRSFGTPRQIRARRAVATAARAKAAAPRRRPKAKPKAHTHWHRVKSHERRTNPSPAQLAARARFAAAARAGTLKKGSKLSTRNARVLRGVTPARDKEAGPMARRKRRRRTTAAASHRRRRNPVRRKKTHRRKHALFTSAARKRVGLNPRRRRRRHVRMNPHRRRRRSYRRNPLGLPSGRGFMGTAIKGVKNGFVVVLGRGAINLVGGKLSTTLGLTSAAPKAGVNLLAAVGLSYVVKKISKSDETAAMFLAGAMSKVLEPLVGMVPVVGPLLAPGGVSSWPHLAAYPQPGALAAWPHADQPIQRGNLAGWDDYDPNLSDGIFS